MLLQLNVRYRTRVAPKLTGIKHDPRAPQPAPAPPATAMPTDGAEESVTTTPAS